MFNFGRNRSQNDYSAPELVNLLRSETRAERDGAIIMLRKAAQRNDEGIMDALTPLLTEQNADLRLIAIDIIQHTASNAGTEALISLLSDPDEEVQRSALTALKARRNASPEPLYAALQHPDPQVRWRIVQTLSAAVTAVHLRALSEAAADPNELVRREAVVGLGRSNHELASKPLLIALANDKDDDVRWRAAQALAKLKAMSSADGLAAALNDPDEQVRLAVGVALAKLGDMRAFDVLVDSLASAGDDIIQRNWSIEGLQALGEPGIAAIEALTDE